MVNYKTIVVFEMLALDEVVPSLSLLEPSSLLTWISLPLSRLFSIEALHPFFVEAMHPILFAPMAESDLEPHPCPVSINNANEANPDDSEEVFMDNVFLEKTLNSKTLTLSPIPLTLNSPLTRPSLPLSSLTFFVVDVLTSFLGLQLDDGAKPSTKSFVISLTFCY